MPQQNFANTSGPASAGSFQTTFTGDVTRFPQRVVLSTNGTTPVNVFSTTNLVSGTFTGRATVISKDGTAGAITLKQNKAGTETTVFTITNKGTAGSMTGTHFTAVSFLATGTATVQSSTSSNAVVEIDFVASNPALPGAQ